MMVTRPGLHTSSIWQAKAPGIFCALKSWLNHITILHIAFVKGKSSTRNRCDDLTQNAFQEGKTFLKVKSFVSTGTLFEKQIPYLLPFQA